MRRKVYLGTMSCCCVTVVTILVLIDISTTVLALFWGIRLGNKILLAFGCICAASVAVYGSIMAYAGIRWIVKRFCRCCRNDEEFVVFDT